ncbi:MAG: RDD family protein [Armatimonadetes bacterium]|nr:RDD family protein [Armatimonadota bacterium]
MHDRLYVLTPEKTIVNYTVAGISARIGAHLVDLLICFGATIAISLLVSVVGWVIPEGLLALFMGLFITFGIFAYFILMEAYCQGQTLGKRSAGIRVLMSDGTPITPRAAMLRNLLRLGDFMPMLYMTGIISIMVNQRAQRLGDMFADTVVVRTSRKIEGFSAAPHRAGIHPLEHTIGDLGGMTLAEYIAIKRLCDRFPYLPQPEQVRSIQSIWIPFAEEKGIHMLPDKHPIYQMEAVVMKYGRLHKLV